MPTSWQRPGLPSSRGKRPTTTSSARPARSSAEPISPDEFQQKVTALTGERDALREQLKAGGAGDLSAQLAAKEAELKNTKKLYADTKADLDKLTKESVSKMTALQIGYEIKGAAAALKFKPEIPQAVADLAVQNIVKELETAHKPEFIPDGNGGQRLVFKDENGVQLNNPANGLQPFTATELLTQKLSALGILAEGQKQAGAGTKSHAGECGRQPIRHRRCPYAGRGRRDDRRAALP